MLEVGNARLETLVLQLRREGSLELTKGVTADHLAIRGCEVDLLWSAMPPLNHKGLEHQPRSLSH